MNFSFFTKHSNSFSGDILKLVAGTVMAQALGILFMPLITRFFSPDAYGLAAIFSSITGIVGVIVCLRYELAIMLPETHEEAINILAVSLLSAIIITFLSGIIVWVGNKKIADWLHAPQLEKYLWLLPLTVFFQGVFLSLNYWNTRQKHFGRLSIAQIISSVTTLVTKLSAGFVGFVSGGVLIGTSVFGIIVATSVLGGQIWRDDKKIFIENIRSVQIYEGCIRFKKFPIIDIWGGLLNSISWQLPSLMLSSFFSTTVVGLYALGLAVIKAPLGIIGGAMSQVFFQKACDEKNIIANNAELVENLMDTLMFIGILPTMILAMIGEELFSVVFGGRWAEAGLYTQILSPWILFWFISSPLSYLFTVYEKQGLSFFVHLIIFITRVVSLYIGGIYKSIYLALTLFSLTGIVVYGYMAVLNIKLAKASGKRIALNFFKYSTYALPSVFCLFIVKYLFKLNPVIILVTAVLAVIVYSILFRNKIQYFMKLRYK